MNIYIVNSKCKKKDYDGLVLNENDFHPCKPFFKFHPNIKAESIDEIHIRGILEQHPYLRTVLKCCDYMLKVNGKLEIDYYNLHFDTNGYTIRGINEWMYELSLVFKDRIDLKSKDKSLNGKYSFVKTGACLPKKDDIESWSFGIVSDGRKNERILKIIEQISSFKIPNYEILICGPAPCQNLPSNVRIIDDSPFYRDIRIPISKKKNCLIENARYNNLIIMHDRMFLPDNWYEQMKKHGNYFDCLCFPVLNEDNHNNRMLDWTYQPVSTSIKSYWESIKYVKTLLDYDEWRHDIYINGGFFLIKRHLALPIKLNPNLNWGEKEDTDFSHRLYEDGVLIQLDPQNPIYSQPARFSGSNGRLPFLKKIRFILGAMRRRHEEVCKWNKYLEQ